MMKISRVAVLLAFVGWFLCTDPAEAWMRIAAPDPEIVERAELIVVAHMKDASIVRVPHEERNGGGTSEQHNATLVITEVLKGECSERELPIILHYGLRPAIPLKDRAQFFPSPLPPDQKLPAAGTTVFLYDIAEMSAKCSGDIRQDQIWFLRFPRDREQKYWGADTTNALGLWNPEDIQTPDLKQYFQALLTDRPEDQLRRYAGSDSALALRSRLYLERRELAEVLEEPDLVKRAGRLLPFCLFMDEKDANPVQSEALSALTTKCGTAGAARLKPIFEDPRYEAMQSSIMQRWAEAEYRDAIPLLIELLDTEDRFWAVQTPAELDRVTSFHSTDDPTPAQIRSFQRVVSILYAFRRLADPSAMIAVLNTKLLWEKRCPQAEDQQIPQECDAALAAMRAGPTRN